MFVELLRVKQLRADRAASATKAAAAALEDAKAAVTAAEQAVEEHRAFREMEEPRLFAEVKGETVPLSRLDKLKEDIALLKARELELIEAVETAKKAIAPAEAALREAEAAQAEAERAVTKFEEFVAEEKKAAQIEATMREDAEVEEVSEAIFATRRHE